MPIMIYAIAVLSVLLALLAIVLVNMAVLPSIVLSDSRSQGSSGGSTNNPRVAILVPARDEEANIEACLRSLLRQDYQELEVWVYDDASTDRTAEILARLEAECQHLLHVVHGSQGPPAGWLGKASACHSLYAAMRMECEPDYVLFTDADVWLGPSVVQEAVTLAQQRKAGLLSIFPRQTMATWAERLAVPSYRTSQSTISCRCLLRSLCGQVRPSLPPTASSCYSLERHTKRAAGIAACGRRYTGGRGASSRGKEGGLPCFAGRRRAARAHPDVSHGGRGVARLLQECLCLLRLFALLSGDRDRGPAGAVRAPYLAGCGFLALFGRIYLSGTIPGGAGDPACAVAAVKSSPADALLQPFAIVYIIAIAINSMVWAITGKGEWKGRAIKAGLIRSLPSRQRQESSSRALGLPRRIGRRSCVKRATGSHVHLRLISVPEQQGRKEVQREGSHEPGNEIGCRDAIICRIALQPHPVVLHMVGHGSRSRSRPTASRAPMEEDRCAPQRSAEQQETNAPCKKLPTMTQPGKPDGERALPPGRSGTSTPV